MVAEAQNIGLTNADDVVQALDFSVVTNQVEGEILDLAEAVTAEVELVCAKTGSDVSEVKGLLAVVGRARISVRYSHVLRMRGCQRQTS